MHINYSLEWGLKRPRREYVWVDIAKVIRDTALDFSTPRVRAFQEAMTTLASFTSRIQEQENAMPNNEPHPYLMDAKGEIWWRQVGELYCSHRAIGAWTIESIAEEYGPLTIPVAGEPYVPVDPRIAGLPEKVATEGGSFMNHIGNGDYERDGDRWRVHISELVEDYGPIRAVTIGDEVTW